MKIAVSGIFHGRDGIAPGDTIEVDDQVGARYCALNYAEPVASRKEERAVAPKAEERGGDPVPAAPKRAPRR